MDLLLDLPAARPPPPRDSASPISDCIIVRDCDSSSVATVDTGITSMLPTSDASKANSRAGSVPLPMSSAEELVSSEEEQVGKESPEPVNLEQQPDNALESENNHEHELEKAEDKPTRVLRQRPPRPPPAPPRTPKPAKKSRSSLQDGDTKQPSPPLSDVIQIRDVSETVNVKSDDTGHRRRSSRLSMIGTSPKPAMSMETPNRTVGKRSHEVMNTGSRSVNAKLGSSSSETKQQSMKRAKVSKKRGEEEEDVSSDDSEISDEDSLKAQPPKKKKIWAIQGLFMGETEDFDPRRRTKRGRLSGAGELPNKRKPALPLPIFHGRALMDNRRDFKLPFNVFSPSPYKAHPPGWKSLSRNILVGDARELWKSESEPSGKCVCTLEKGCDEACLNRCVYYECNDENCNVGPEHCQNRQFAQLKKRVMKKTKFAEGVEVVETKDRGFGLRAIRSFEPNQIIVEYCGEIISQEETESRMKKIYKNNSCYYLMLFDQSMIIDATRGSIARFVNHSCEPNCRMEKWIVDNKPRMALFAGENGVETGEELTYDYNFNWFSGVSQQVCRCGSANCRGAMGKRTDGRKTVEEKVANAKKTNRIKGSITVSAIKSSRATSTKSAKPTTRRPFKIVKKAIVKKTVKNRVIKKTVVKTGPNRKLKPALATKSKSARMSIASKLQQRSISKTYASAPRSIKAECSEQDEMALESMAETGSASTTPQQPKGTTLGNIQTLANAMSEKTGLQGTVLDTIVVVG